MTRKYLLLVAKICVVISAILLGYGFSFYIVQGFDNSDNIISTTKDSKEIINVTSKGSSSFEDRTVNNREDIINENSSGNIEEANKKLQQIILDNYHIRVLYGSDVPNYSVGGISTVQILDSQIINSKLSDLNYAMSLYPSSFFEEIEKGDFYLTIYLIKKYSLEDVTGITDSTKKSVIISLATDYPIKESFYHESYHYIEAYLASKKITYSTWSSLNPSTYQYGVVDKKLSYSNAGSKDSYFVNDYAQEDQYEDRASTFEYMMKDKRPECFNSSHIMLKSKYIANQLQEFFSSVSSKKTEYWERYLN